jgi:hypothetical protein
MGRPRRSLPQPPRYRRVDGRLLLSVAALLLITGTIAWGSYCAATGHWKDAKELFNQVWPVEAALVTGAAGYYFRVSKPD